MNISSKTIVTISLLFCIIVDSINGFNVGRYRTKRYIRKRIDKNGFDATAAVKNLKHGYEYVSSFFNKGQAKDAKISASGVGSSPLSGRLNSADCDDCFLGMQVSRREAYVEFVLKVSEWFGWLLAVSLFPDPELLEDDK